MSKFRSMLTVVISILVLVSCGGGGNDITVNPASKLRTDLYYGYYGSDATSVTETKSHTNLLFESNFFGEEQTISNIRQAQLPTILDVSYYVYSGTGNSHVARVDGEMFLRAFLSRLAAENLLQYIVAFYPIDEPDGTVASSKDISTVNATIRKVASEFPALSNVKLAVIYAGSARLTNISEYDWVGFDHYSEKSGIFANGEYGALLAAMKPEQRIILVPGGSFGQDVTPFFNKAETDSRVIALIPFLWIDTPDMKGIRSIQSKKSYCLAGEQIKTPGKTGACT